MYIKTVSAQILREWLNSDGAMVIDVREPAEYGEVNIPGAILLPLGTFSIDLLPKNIGAKKLVMQCRSGGRSARACEKLLSENPDIEVYNLEGGIRAWVEAGCEINGNGSNLGICAVK